MDFLRECFAARRKAVRAAVDMPLTKRVEEITQLQSQATDDATTAELAGVKAMLSDLPEAVQVSFLLEEPSRMALLEVWAPKDERLVLMPFA